MKTTTVITTLAVSAGLLFGGLAQAKEKEHEENLSASNVPAAVQKAADGKAKGAKIVRWEKEGANYEAVIEKDGKQWGYKFDPSGKSLGKHDESKEKEEHHR